ncbi:MAG: helix-turn-helix domain-containing protein [Bacteroidales bacterium]|nr:helix-turn-helix domain-containing protein [Bacteroidales bacterium]
MDNINIVEFLIIIGGAQGVVFAILLLIRSLKQNFFQNLWLSVFIYLFSIVVIKGWYIGSGFYLKFPEFLFLPAYFSWAIGPSFYFYVVFLIKRNYSFRLKHLLHFIPFVFQLAYQLIIFVKPVSEKLDYFHSDYLFLILPIEDIIGIISLTIYYTISFKILKKYQSSIIKNYTDVRKMLYKWINHFVIASYIMLVGWALTFVIDFLLFDYNKSYSFYYPIYLTMIFILYWIIYRGFISTTRIQPESQSIEGTNFILPEIDIKKCLLKLDVAMKRDKLYLKPKLSLNELAENIDINPKYLSQIINKNFNKSYSEYINTYRIEYAKKELLSIKNTNFTISAISENCGFNSKSTFNETFKKLTNQTPSQFMKSKT